MTSFARAERGRLADTLAVADPDAPTLCEGWTVRDLVAHLLVRERRPDAAAGLVLPPLAGHLERVRRTVATRPYAELVAGLRTGPPRWSPLALPGADSAANSVELAVHHEDVRRARPGWAPRVLAQEDQDLLWQRLPVPARLSLRRSPVGVTLRRADAPGTEHAAHQVRGRGTVVVTGEPLELLLFVMGRGAHARVDLEGAQEDVAALQDAPLAA